MILTDARDLDPDERTSVEGSAVRHLAHINDLLQPGMLPDGPLYVHFDTDVIDAAAAPAMNYPVAGGPSPDELRAVFARLAQTGRIAAVSVSLWEPSLDPHGQTRAVALELVNVLLASQAA